MRSQSRIWCQRRCKCRLSAPEFMDRVGELDAEWARRAEAARAAGATLKYVATVPAAGPIAVGVREVSASSLLGALQGPENVVVIRTARYDANPLTIVGPGAGGRHRRRHDERHAGLGSTAGETRVIRCTWGLPHPSLT